ncbi:phosphoadenosine phosphosulfate reductase family protein [Actinomadura graeca]|uniref:Phosphoadenosine phosphosulfate reductase family protein n=1 Tax=Actinomadura graeca TaxID=2750812 RepID=A0ABX8R695_9ACTN|nr:phosphoadenosine phosphosulfate reductase family protein [Actinomadura graeca]QXJ25939.1 phosphoadenosine phosphosulfate reductase family protein [Actinomadura graeca]
MEAAITAVPLSLGMALDSAPDLGRADVIVVASSAGKDSQAMLDQVAELARAAGVLERVVVVHNDLGVTDRGHPVEWPGTTALARIQADHYGLPLEILHRDKGGLWQQARNERHAWPSAAARWCTADQKTGQAMKLVTRRVAAAGITGRPAEVIYCVGLRAQESPSRARKSVQVVDQGRSSSVRTITRWHPILDWPQERVWKRIHASGVPYHPAYDWGMRRLSCSLCVLASREDLVLAARLRPALAREYLELETQFRRQDDERLRKLWRFRSDLSMAQVIEAAETAGPLAFACPRRRCPAALIPPDDHDPFAAQRCPVHPSLHRDRLVECGGRVHGLAGPGAGHLRPVAGARPPQAPASCRTSLPDPAAGSRCGAGPAS